jgi:hypothetical protein
MLRDKEDGAFILVSLEKRAKLTRVVRYTDRLRPMGRGARLVLLHYLRTAPRAGPRRTAG